MRIEEKSLPFSFTVSSFIMCLDHIFPPPAPARNTGWGRHPFWFRGKDYPSLFIPCSWKPSHWLIVPGEKKKGGNVQEKNDMIRPFCSLGCVRMRKDMDKITTSSWSCHGSLSETPSKLINSQIQSSFWFLVGRLFLSKGSSALFTSSSPRCKYYATHLLLSLPPSFPPPLYRETPIEIHPCTFVWGGGGSTKISQSTREIPSVLGGISKARSVPPKTWSCDLVMQEKGETGWTYEKR